MNEKTFELGERRRVTLEVWLSDGQAFQPIDPQWVLTYMQKEASGACTIVQNGDRWQLTAEVQPKKKGVYRLQYTFGLGTELIKRSVSIRVV